MRPLLFADFLDRTGVKVLRRGRHETIRPFSLAGAVLCGVIELAGCAHSADTRLTERSAAIQHARLIEEPMKVPSVVPGNSGSRTFMLDGLVIRPAVDGQ